MVKASTLTQPDEADLVKAVGVFVTQLATNNDI